MREVLGHQLISVNLERHRHRQVFVASCIRVVSGIQKKHCLRGLVFLPYSLLLPHFVVLILRFHLDCRHLGLISGLGSGHSIPCRL